ncbi:flavin reductase family protein [Rhodovulum sp. DZ06]|uniref:flavin reductase family protein n=1 Tax=Rhodovulum sp. DZ06 TaxID=3425126 RepID=UPI003D32A3A8
MRASPDPDPTTPAAADPGLMFREAMRRPANAVAVIAARDGARRAGLTATAVCSLSDAPPSLLVCVNRAGPALETIRAAGRFSVNYLTEAQVELAALFAGRAGRFGAEKFDEGAWIEGPDAAGEAGAPMLSGALAAFDCVLEEVVEHATHAILIGHVARLTVEETPGSLVYSAGGFCAATPLDGAGRAA